MIYYRPRGPGAGLKTRVIRMGAAAVSRYIGESAARCVLPGSAPSAGRSDMVPP